MANIQELLKNLDLKNPVHRKIIESVNQTNDLYSKLIGDALDKRTTSDSVDRIIDSIDENISFNNEMHSGKDRRGNILRANVFKLNAVVSAARVARSIEDFTRIEIIPVNSRSDAAQKAIFIARNIDGVLESSINGIINLTTSSKTEDAISALQAKQSFEKSLEKDLASLHNSIRGQLDKEVGTRYQLLVYNRDKARENIEKITKLIEVGKTVDEVSETLNISIPGIKTVESEVKASIDLKKIESNKASIKKSLEEKEPYRDIAKSLGVDLNRLANYCRENGLFEYNEKQFIKDNLEKIAGSLKVGKTFEEISNELGVNKTRLESIAKNNNLAEKVEKKEVEKKAS